MVQSVFLAASRFLLSEKESHDYSAILKICNFNCRLN
jgi:hypothetical protein